MQASNSHASHTSSVQTAISTILSEIEKSFLAGLSADKDYSNNKINKKIAAWIILLENMYYADSDYIRFLEEFDRISKLFQHFPHSNNPLLQLRTVINANASSYAQGDKFWTNIFPRIHLINQIEHWKSAFPSIILTNVKRSLSLKKIEQPVTLGKEEGILKDKLTTCLVNINLYLTQRAQETRTGWKKFFSFGHFSAQDYYNKRQDWYLFLFHITKYRQRPNQNLLSTELERLAQKYDKGSARFSRLLRELKTVIDQEVNNEEQLLRCLPIEKMINDKKIYSSQSNITHQLANHYATCTLFSRKPALEEMHVYTWKIKNSGKEFLDGPLLLKLETKLCLA